MLEVNNDRTRGFGGSELGMVRYLSDAMLSPGRGLSALSEDLDFALQLLRQLDGGVDKAQRGLNATTNAAKSVGTEQSVRPTQSNDAVVAHRNCSAIALWLMTLGKKAEDIGRRIQSLNTRLPIQQARPLVTKEGFPPKAALSQSETLGGDIPGQSVTALDAQERPAQPGSHKEDEFSQRNASERQECIPPNSCRLLHLRDPYDTPINLLPDEPPEFPSPEDTEQVAGTITVPKHFAPRLSQLPSFDFPIGPGSRAWKRHDIRQAFSNTHPPIESLLPKPLLDTSWNIQFILRDSIKRNLPTERASTSPPEKFTCYLRWTNYNLGKPLLPFSTVRNAAVRIAHSIDNVDIINILYTRVSSGNIFMKFTSPIKAEQYAAYVRGNPELLGSQSSIIPVSEREYEIAEKVSTARWPDLRPAAETFRGVGVLSPLARAFTPTIKHKITASGSSRSIEGTTLVGGSSRPSSSQSMKPRSLVSMDVDSPTDNKSVEYLHSSDEYIKPDEPSPNLNNTIDDGKTPPINKQGSRGGKKVQKQRENKLLREAREQQESVLKVLGLDL